MNEKIKSIAIECAGQLEWDGPTPESYTFTPDEITRFANWIIKECAALAYHGPGGLYDHFGVKE
jgi:hypothetical protein